MELGNLVWFSSREHAFAVRERHCLDLECPCTDVWLTFSEVEFQGKALPAHLPSISGSIFATGVSVGRRNVPRRSKDWCASFWFSSPPSVSRQ